MRQLLSVAGPSYSLARLCVFAAGAAVALVVGLTPPASAAQSVDPLEVPGWATTRVSSPPPARVAAEIEPFAHLRAASEGAVDQLEALRAWNAAGRLPVKNGFMRPLPLSEQLRLGPEVATEAFGTRGGGVFREVEEEWVWGTAVRVDNAHRLRLHLADVDLPAGTRMWVYGDDGEMAGPFGLELVHEGSLWTPTVAGPTVRFELAIPRAELDSGHRGFSVDQVLEQVVLDESGAARFVLEPRLGECLRDVTCFGAGHFPAIASAVKAVGQLVFIVPGGQAACTGTLLNDVDATTIVPYLLTANHCFSTQAAAATVEARFDYKTASCNGSVPPFGSHPRVNGATLLATGAGSDFTLVRLSKLPPGPRSLLGWTSDPAAINLSTRLTSISHPIPGSTVFSQAIAQGHKVATPNNCGLSPTKFIAMVNDIRGGTFGGSSGSALMLDNGQVVGQLTGGCGPNPDDGCNQNNDDVWGAFSASFPSLAPFLNTPGGGGGDPAPPTATWLTTPALPGFQFQVRINNGTIGKKEACVSETLCVSAALAGRSEVFVRIVGPKPNGFLHVNILKFSTSRVEIWVRRGGVTKYYDVKALAPGGTVLEGLVDPQGFVP